MLIRSIVAFVVLTLAGLTALAQSDWQKYPERSIAQIIERHSGPDLKKTDLIISADPFPSKTSLTYTGQRRPLDEWKRYFINLWAETRNLPPENPRMLEEEFLFKEKNTEYWIPVVKTLVPYFAKELKQGDEVTAYYFFLGGYYEKTLREKKAGSKKKLPTVSDSVTWVFALEEFQKPPATKLSTESALSTLAAAIEGSPVAVGSNEGVFVDPRQTRSKSKVIFTGEQRLASEERIKVLTAWLEKRSLAPNTLKLLTQEVRFLEGDSEYWMPVRKAILDTMLKELKQGDVITIHTILAGGLAKNGTTDWVFVVGEFTK